MPKRMLWDLALFLIGMFYVIVMLFANLESPVFAIAVAALAAVEIVEGHRANH